MIVIAVILLVTGAARLACAHDASAPDRDWSRPGGDDAATRYSDLDEIDARTVARLRPAWTLSTGVLRGHEGAPLVVGSRMFLATPFPNRVLALDLDHEGRIDWSYEPRQDPKTIEVMCCDTVNRGLAYDRGRLFLNQADATLVALDARNGAVLWSVRNGDPARGETGTSAPLVAGDAVIVGVSGGEFGARGRLTAYSVADGHLLWRAWSVGPDADLLVDPAATTAMGKPIGVNSSLSTWKGDGWTMGGGPTWGWLSYDATSGLVYGGTGNPGSWNPVQRPGDNRWSDTIFARDARTGVARWLYQVTPHDQWDFDTINEDILADIPVHGTKRAVLVHFDRNGFAYTIDRASGLPLVAERFDPSVNWASRIDLVTGRPVLDPAHAPETRGEDEVTRGICPSAIGAKNEAPAAFSPRTGLFYVPTNHLCMDEEPFAVDYTAGQPYTGATLTMYPPKGERATGAFIAWDAGEGRIVWSDPEPFSVWSGALATAGDVVFYGTLEGWLKAVDARTGALLWQFKTPSGIVGNVMTYRHDGRQYVAVLSGVGGWAGIGLAAGFTDDADGDGAVGAYRALDAYTTTGGVLTVFSLDGVP